MELPMQVCIATLLAVAAPVHSSLPTPSPSTLLETAPAPVGQEANDTQFFLSDVFSPLLPEGFSPLLLPLSLEADPDDPNYFATLRANVWNVLIAEPNDNQAAAGYIFVFVWDQAAANVPGSITTAPNGQLQSEVTAVANRGTVTDPSCDLDVPPPSCAKTGGSLLVMTERPGMGKNCLLTLVSDEEALPDDALATRFNAAAEEIVLVNTNLQILPFSVTDAATNAATDASEHAYNLRPTMVAPRESMGSAGEGSVWYQANVATRQFPVQESSPGQTVLGPPLAVAFLAPAPVE